MYMSAYLNLADLKAIGGTDAKSILYGGYNTTGNSSGVVRPQWYGSNGVTHGDWNGGTDWARSIESNYAYRNVPQYFAYWPTRNPGYDYITKVETIRVAYVSPNIQGTMHDMDGAPMFKTQKILSGRALVTDSFGKNMADIDTVAGNGWYGHRDGYNVLYGDWHAKWYGDPKQRFIFWPRMSTSFGSGTAGKTVGIDTNVISDFVCLTNSTFSRATLGSTLAWHVFDAQAGIDVSDTP